LRSGAAKPERLATVLSSTLAVREGLGLYYLSVLRLGCRILVASRPSRPIRRRSTVDEGEVGLICDAKRRAAVGAARRVRELEAEIRGLTRCAAEGG
jgi:hypothetical protein